MTRSVLAAAALIVFGAAAVAALIVTAPAAPTPATTPSPYGMPLTECADGSWSTAAGPDACALRGGAHRG
ncbi:hypothetical protein ACTOB_001376 [Actinoplanes oblitus]|uniref:Uncharacterized protein n=1 Tax=Actinoplanes oblitus TaxID=3040509 RepID=A0ABY8WK25_9ACTN|nr:hypothetical protein [Actinoplanes oblitus]WIM97822.1 hypothetical protein ACTOB_001376 [Actinoplanes oblitus]